MNSQLQTNDNIFYAELITVTVVGLVTANVWIRLMNRSLKKYFPDSIKAELLVAVVITVLAILFLAVVFSRVHKKQQRYIPHMHRLIKREANIE